MPAQHPRIERVTAVILAAGESRRFGDEKLLAVLDGRPLLQHVIDAANASNATEVVVVVGHRGDDVRHAIRPGRARIVVNDAYASGQSTSLRAGVVAAAGTDAVVVLLGDQPRVTSRLIDALIERQRATDAAAVICVARGRRSPPTLLHRALWPALESLVGDVGARELLSGRGDVVELDVDTSLGSLDDVDEPMDLARLTDQGADSDRGNA